MPKEISSKNEIDQEEEEEVEYSIPQESISVQKDPSHEAVLEEEEEEYSIPQESISVQKDPSPKAVSQAVSKEILSQAVS